MSKINLRDRISSIPNLPGIYFFKNKNNKIIYIGKSKSIRKRVQSYFSSKKKDVKTSVLVGNVTDIDWLVVRSETEALLAESNLIKKHRPKYNVFLKDDKTYPYIKITNEPYPRIEIIRMKDLKKDLKSLSELINSAPAKIKVAIRAFSLLECMNLSNEYNERTTNKNTIFASGLMKA